MKIPEFMLKQKCTIYPFDKSTPSGYIYLTESIHKCRVEDNVKLNFISGNEKAEWVAYIKVFVNYASTIAKISVDSKVTIEGDSNIYVVVNAKKIGGFVNSHWELVLQ